MEPIWYLLGFNMALFAALMLSGRISSRTTGKRTLRRLLLIISITLLFLMIVPERVAATLIIERPLPTDSLRTPMGIAVAKNGSFVVFGEKHSGSIGFMGTGRTLLNGSYNGKFLEYPLPGTTDGPSAEPRDVALGNQTLKSGSVGPKEGFVYFTEFVRNKIGRLKLATPTSGYPIGRIDEWGIPTSNSGPLNLAIDPYNGSVWFTEYQTNKIGRMYNIGEDNWKMVEYYLPTSNSYPVDIAVDPNYWHTSTTGEVQTYIWFTMSGSDKIGRLNSETGEIVEYSTRGTPWGITVTPQSFVWFTQKLGDRIAKLHPWSGVITEIPLPVHSPGNEPLYIANDTDNNLWFTESVNNIIGKYIPGMNVFQEYVVPSTYASKPHGIAITPRLWGTGIDTSQVNYWGTFSVFFTEEVANKIGEIIVPSGPWTSTTTVGYISSVSTTTSSATTLSTSATTVSTNTTLWRSSPAVVWSKLTYTSTTATLVDTISVLQTSTTSTWTKTTTSTSVTTTSSTSTSVTTSTSTSGTTTTLTSMTTSTSSSTTTTTTTTSTTYTSTSYSPTVTTPITIGATTSYSSTTTTTTTSTVTQTSALTLTSTTTTIATVTTTPAAARACVIASVAYGSELAPEVQFLRGFRDGPVMSTFGGAQFMRAFNAFYYSFSPKVAEFTAGSPTLQAVTRALISPLLASLRVAAVICQLCPESQLMVVVAGIIASGMIGAVYLSPIAVLLKTVLRGKKYPRGV